MAIARRTTTIFGRQENEIGQRRGYPKALKLAAVKQSQKKKTSVAAAAEMFNVATGTVQTWRRDAGVQGRVPTGLAKHQAAARATKAYNTPTHNSDGSITYQGKMYR